MKKLFVTGIVFLCGATLRADFTYQQTSQMTGGTLFQMIRDLGPLSRQAREPIVVTTIVKDNRMARITKDNINIIDLDKETITEIDTAKKTYSVVTFAQMKQAMEDAMARAQDARNQRGKQAADNPNVEASFKVDAKATGQTKTISGLEAKEVMLTMTMEATNTDTAQGGALNIVTDSWMSNVAGYEEVKQFQRKMGEKMGYLFGSGMASLGQMRPETLKGFEEVGKEMAKAEGVPVESTMKMGLKQREPIPMPRLPVRASLARRRHNNSKSRILAQPPRAQRSAGWGWEGSDAVATRTTISRLRNSSRPEALNARRKPGR